MKLALKLRLPQPLKHLPPLRKIGVILAAHGVRGQVKIRSLTEPPEALFKRKPLTSASGKTFAVKKMGGNAPVFIASIEGITDRNAAELLAKTELFAPEQASDPADMTGFEARLENGKIYGRVIGVYNFGAGDIVEIELTSGQTEMLPLKEPFVTSVETKKNYLVVTPPEYLEVEKN